MYGVSGIIRFYVYLVMILLGLAFYPYLFGLLDLIAPPVEVSADDQAEEKVPAALVDQAVLASAEFDSTGMWPSSVVGGEAPDGVDLTVVPSPTGRYCLEGTFDGSDFSYYFSPSTSSPLVRGVHPGSCELGAEGAGGAPAVDVDLSALEAPVPSEPTDWTWLVVSGSVVLGAGGLGALGLGGYRVVSSAKRARDRRSAAEQVLVERWERAKAALAALRVETYRVESDVLAHLDFPALFDVGEPRTAAYLEALEEVAAADLDSVPLHDEVLITRLESRVASARRAWDAAWRNAVQLRTSRLSQPDRSRVGKARKLLERMLDESTPLLERQACYEKAVELLDGIVFVPVELRRELESSVRLALPPGSVGDSVSIPSQPSRAPVEL